MVYRGQTTGPFFSGNGSRSIERASPIYVTAASIKGLVGVRLAIAMAISSLLFALAHTRTMGISWLVFFGMGTLYALLRWRSNSTAAAALMHATYNAVIALAMLHV
jgi:membrane protease YdiL (CAAX protease family)